MGPSLCLVSFSRRFDLEVASIRCWCEGKSSKLASFRMTKWQNLTLLSSQKVFWEIAHMLWTDLGFMKPGLRESGYKFAFHKSQVWLWTIRSTTVRSTHNNKSHSSLVTPITFSLPFTVLCSTTANKKSQAAARRTSIWRQDERKMHRRSFMPMAFLAPNTGYSSADGKG